MEPRATPPWYYVCHNPDCAHYEILRTVYPVRISATIFCRPAPYCECAVLGDGPMAEMKRCEGPAFDKLVIPEGAMLKVIPMPQGDPLFERV